MIRYFLCNRGGGPNSLKMCSYYMNGPLANRMSKRIREKQDGDVSDDETIQFKSYLMSMGISDPVTRETSGGSKQTYFVQLAKEIESALRQPGYCEFLVRYFVSSKIPSIFGENKANYLILIKKLQYIVLIKVWNR